MSVVTAEHECDELCASTHAVSPTEGMGSDLDGQDDEGRRMSKIEEGTRRREAILPSQWQKRAIIGTTDTSEVDLMGRPRSLLPALPCQNKLISKMHFVLASLI